MKYIFLTISLLISLSGVKAQTGLTDPLTSIAGWTAGTGYTLSEATDGTEMKVVCTTVGTSYQIFQYNFTSTPLNLAGFPYLQIKVRNSGTSNIQLRIDLQDATGNVTNTSPISYILPGNNAYTTYNFDYTGRFTQTYPATATVNSAAITNVNIYINPGGSAGYSGTIYFDSLSIGSDANIPAPPKGIKLNQIGFYPNQNKIAIAVETTKDSFYLVSSTKLDTLFRGLLDTGSTSKWVYSGESTQIADFTAYDSVGGTYYITTDSIYSYPFTIAPQVHNGVAKGLLKSFYYNRASMAIVSPWGESWTRAEGLADNVVYIDATAATADRPTGTVISSPKGWFDAGDYNKYVVNAGITTYSLLSLYEHFPTYFDTLNTDIPESNNGIPDVLDEALWEIRWLFTAQDTNNGGVYHKITDPSFDALTTLPSQDNQKRYAVYMGTAATLDFTAVMAQAYRIFSDSASFPNAHNQPLADSCLKAAIKAYNWAKANPAVTVTGNPSNITTGTYADGTLTDELAWARMELYAALRMDSLFVKSEINSPAPSYSVPGWQTVNSLGLMTLLNYRHRLNTSGYADTTTMKSLFNNSVANVCLNSYNTSAYKVAMGITSGDFDWGSNANAGNEGMILLEAYRLSGNKQFFDAALSNLDYVLGRNGTFYCFITGFGSNPPKNPQHRTSDALMALHGGAPVPGLVVGGANPGQQDDCPGYTSSYPASSYLDTQCSYSTNEPAINYTAAVTYLAAGIEAILAGASYTPAYTPPPSSIVTGIISTVVSTPIVNLFPNPAKGQVTVEFTANGTAQLVVVDMTGRIVVNENVSGNGVVDVPLDITALNKGIYVVSITTAQGTITKKLVVQ